MRIDSPQACGRVAALSTRLFEVGLYRLAASHRGADHEHGRPAIAWGAGGAMQVVSRTGGTHDLFTDPPLFIPADYRHHERVPFGVALCVLARPIEAEFPGEFRASAGTLRTPHGRDAGFALLRELTHADDVSELAVDAALLDVLTALARDRPDAGASDASAPWLSRVGERLADEYVDPPSAAELARDAGVSPSHLSRAFRAAYGVSIPVFVRRLRVRRAASLLVRTDRPVADVALAAGFYDQSHLTRSFGRAMGVTPAAYRRLASG